MLNMLCPEVASGDHYAPLPFPTNNVIAHHITLANKARTGPKPKPELEPSPTLEWTEEEVLSWVKETVCAHYSPERSEAWLPECIAAFEWHCVDGKALLQFEPSDWQAVVKRVNLRMVLMEAAQELTAERIAQRKAQPPPPEPPKRASSGIKAVASSELMAAYPPSPIHPSAHTAAAWSSDMIAAYTEAMPALRDDDPDNFGNFCTWDQEFAQKPAGKVSWSMMRKKSRFSNQTAINLPWRPNPEWRWYMAKAQLCMLRVLRYLNLLLTIGKSWRTTDMLLTLIPAFAVYICLEHKIQGNYNPTLYMSSIMLPLSFAINNAYRQRELALQNLAYMKGCAFNLYSCVLTWHNCVPGLYETFMLDVRISLIYGFDCMYKYLTSRNEQDKEIQLSELYRSMSCLEYSIDLLRLTGIPPPSLTRPIHDLRDMVACAERVRVFADYRAPGSIKCYVRVVPVIVGVLMAPYFANFGNTYSHAVAYGTAVLFYSLMRFTSNIHATLENPYLPCTSLGDDDAINLSEYRMPRESRAQTVTLSGDTTTKRTKSKPRRRSRRGSGASYGHGSCSSDDGSVISIPTLPITISAPGYPVDSKV